jgi:hypothetical protein
VDERAIKRIVVSDEEVKNQNPVLEALLFGDEEEEDTRPISMTPRQSIGIHPIVGEGSVESYDRLTIRGERIPTEETLFLSYYFTCGSTSSLRSGGPEDLDATYRASRSPGRCSLYAVLRDDRGGEDWRVREIVVE